MKSVAAGQLQGVSSIYKSEVRNEIVQAHREGGATGGSVLPHHKPWKSVYCGQMA